MSAEKDLSDYRALLDKVSAKFSEVFQANQNHMRCGRGCSNCCAPGLTVSPVERENIREFLSQKPNLVSLIKELEKRNPYQGERCSFLDEKGECSIYEVRPIICRSHGAPIFAKNESGQALRDVCPLNFTELQDLAELPAGAFINLDLLNQILALLNQRFSPESPMMRAPLTVSGVLGLEESN